MNAHCRPAVNVLARLLARASGVALVFSVATGGAAALPPPYFPPTVVEPTTDESWRELADRFPLFVKPAGAKTTPADPSAPAAAVEVKPGVEYLRIESISRDLPVISTVLGKTASVVLDLRFLQAGVDESFSLASAIARNELQISLSGSAPAEPLSIAPGRTDAGRGLVLALVNRFTAGPIEAVLDALQQAGEILIVGEKTKGDTGHFNPVDGNGNWKVIAGDYRRAGGVSLLGQGVTPGLTVSVTPAEDESAYQAIASGAAIAELLDTEVDKARYDEARLLRQHDQSSGRRADSLALPAPSGSEPAGTTSRAADAVEEVPPTRDRVLQRAINTVIALRVLRRFPDS